LDDENNTVEVSYHTLIAHSQYIQVQYILSTWYWCRHLFPLLSSAILLRHQTGSTWFCTFLQIKPRYASDCTLICLRLHSH